jgi:hypothetical protein
VDLGIPPPELVCRITVVSSPPGIRLVAVAISWEVPEGGVTNHENQDADED